MTPSCVSQAWVYCTSAPALAQCAGQHVAWYRRPRGLSSQPPVITGRRHSTQRVQAACPFRRWCGASGKGGRWTPQKYHCDTAVRHTGHESALSSRSARAPDTSRSSSPAPATASPARIPPEPGASGCQTPLRIATHAAPTAIRYAPSTSAT